MHKKIIVFVILMVFALGSVMAYSSMTTVSLDYGAVGTIQDFDKEPTNFIGFQFGVYTYSDECSPDGFYSQISFQTLVTDDSNDLFTKDLVNIVFGYARRIDLGGMFDLMVGGGPSYQKSELENAGGQIIDKASMIGLAATAEANFLLSPRMTINWGVTTHVGIYDVKGRKLITKNPVTARTYMGVGFTF